MTEREVRLCTTVARKTSKEWQPSQVDLRGKLLILNYLECSVRISGSTAYV